MSLETQSGGDTLLRNQTEELRTSLRGDILRPVDEACTVWNGMIDKRPALIVECTGRADVDEAVNFARENDLELLHPCSV